ncbi:DotU/TssL family secretion system protein [Andreprevotia chitinilytica]|uniref:DotU/TssL family secretion system protein n=1 Tax=Andreprevotia chitinilytica TaxID=396808 RepID=UPI00055417C1|nr:DotU/TssL family secretion system protein [Andreprevotia chitinilytica]
MTDRDQSLKSGAPLSTAFNEAYVEWLALFQGLLTSTDTDTRAAERAAEEAGALARRLSRVALTRVGSAGVTQVDALQYAFVALIDESLLFADWPGQAIWHDVPLEFRLYGTRTAGERLPMQIDKLLRERDPTTRDLANVYLQVLLLGFLGRLRGDGGYAQHEEWRRALFSFTYQRDADYKRVGAALERPCAVEPIRQPARRMLPDGFRLMLIVLVITLVMVGIGHLFWRDIAHQIEPALYQVGDTGGAAK